LLNRCIVADTLPHCYAKVMSYGITQCYLPPGRGENPAFTPAKAGTQFSNPRGMQGWVDLCYVKADWLGIEPATYKSRMQRPVAAPSRNVDMHTYIHIFINARNCQNEFETLAQGDKTEKTDWNRCDFSWVILKVISFIANRFKCNLSYTCAAVDLCC